MALVALSMVFGLPLFALFQNTSQPVFDADSLADYYENLVSQCTATNPVNCQGEVTNVTYDTDFRQWGLNNTSCIWSSINSPYSLNNYCYYGSALLYPRSTSQTVIYRNTGAYVTNLKARDTFYNPTTKEEYSFNYNPSSGKAVSNPPRVSNFTYFNNISLIPGNIDGLTYNVLDLPASSTIVGVGTASTNYLLTGKAQSVTKYGIETDYTYDAQGNLWTVSNYLDGVKYTSTTFTNYYLGIAQTITKPLGMVTYRVVNPDGTIQSVSDSLNNKTSYLYDANFRLTQITPPLNAFTTISYPDENTKVITRGPSVTTKSFDAMGRALQTTSRDLNDATKTIIMTQNYDSDGRLIFKSLPGWGSASPYGLSTSYDVLDRIASTKRTADNSITSFIYSSPDISSELKPTGHKVVYTHLNYSSPNENQLIQVDEDKVVNPVNSQDRVTTKIARDPTGKILLVNQAGMLREYLFNSNQLLSETHDPERADTVYTYYGGSNLLKTKKIGNNAPITYTYDNAIRMYQVLFSNSNNNNTYSYDTNGRIKNVSTPLTTNSFDYDANGNKKLESLSIDGYTFQIDLGYDSLDRNVSITYPDTSLFGGVTNLPRNTLTSNLDAFGHVTSLHDLNNNILNSAAYNPNGMFSILNYANGATASLSLNNNQWPQTISVKSGSNQISLIYEYDSLGNIKSISDQINPNYTQNFNYDGLSRLIFASYPNASALIPSGQTQNVGGVISYTDTGDITNYGEFAKQPTALSYDPSSQLLINTTGELGARSYNYDSYGHMISNSVYIFGYDPSLNMTSVKDAKTGSIVANYSYDSGDMRVKKVVGATTTYYFYANGNIAFEAGSSGAKEYFYLGQNLISTRALSKSVANYQFYHFNPISSVIAITKPDQSMIQEHYNSYGSKFLDNISFSSSTTVRYAGQISDDETNLIYMKGRYYDPSIARFLTPDPLNFSEATRQSFNKYAYANNNPHKFVDPNGHENINWMERLGAWLEQPSALSSKITNSEHLDIIANALSRTSFDETGLIGIGSAPGARIGSAMQKTKSGQSGKETVTLYHGSDAQGLKELSPPGETGKGRVANGITDAKAKGRDPAPGSEARVEFESNKVAAFRDPNLAKVYAGSNGSVYEFRVPADQIHDHSCVPGSNDIIEGSRFMDEVFVTGRQKVVDEHPGFSSFGGNTGWSNAPKLGSPNSAPKSSNGDEHFGL